MEAIKDYFQNMKAVLRSYNNPLKKIENVKLKDHQEKEFYDNLAKKYILDFDEEVFRYDENEDFPISHQYFYSRLNNILNKSVLDLCCGFGFTSIKCAKRGAIVTGIDISEKMILLSRSNADFNGVADRVQSKVMSVQEMTFENNIFDYAVGIGALHHLQLDLAGPEIARVLKPGGKAIFIEPRIPYKWLIFVRSLLPSKCFESPGGAQLTDKEIEKFSRNFSQADIKYFLFLKKFERFPFFKKLSKQFDEVDEYLINKFPFLKKFYWAFVIELTK